MLTVKKGARIVHAMVMNEAVRGVYGVVQCAVTGCCAYMPLLEEDGDPKDLIAEFLETHDCDPKRFKQNGPLRG